MRHGRVIALQQAGEGARADAECFALKTRPGGLMMCEPSQGKTRDRKKNQPVNVNHP